MCRPSCCKQSNEGAGITAVAVIAVGAVVAVKIGPVVARILDLVVEVLTIIMLTAATALACIVLAWVMVCVVRWQLRRRAAHPRITLPASADGRPGSRRTGRPRAGMPGLRRYRSGAAGHQRQPLPGSALPGMRASPAGWVISMPQYSPRNHRNNPYVLDRAFAQVHHSAAGTIWRFRTELAVLIIGLAAIWKLAITVTTAWTAIILSG